MEYDRAARTPPSKLAPVALVLLACGGLATIAGNSRALAVRALEADLAAAERAVVEHRYDEADTLYREALLRAGPLGEANLPLARALDGLADVERLRGHNAEAEALYVRSIAMWETLLGPAAQPRLAVTAHNLGAVRLAGGRAAESRALFRRAIEIFEATLGPGCPEAVLSRQALSVAEGRAGGGP